MRFAILRVKALGHDLSLFDNHSSDHRIGMRRPPSAPRQFQRAPHENFVMFVGAHSAPAVAAFYDCRRL
jgi:hypothetical protein